MTLLSAEFQPPIELTIARGTLSTIHIVPGHQRPPRGRRERIVERVNADRDD